MRYSVSSDGTSKFRLLRRASWNPVFASSQAAISSCFWFLRSSGPFFGPDRIGSCGVLDFCEWTGHTMCILLDASSSPFGNELFQSIPLRGRLISHHSNDRSAKNVRRRNRCLSSLASSPTCLNGMEKVVFSQDVQLRSMCYVMVIREVTTHDPKVFTVFLLEKGILFFLFIMLKRFPWRAVRRVEVQEDRRVLTDPSAHAHNSFPPCAVSLCRRPTGSRGLLNLR